MNDGKGDEWMNRDKRLHLSLYIAEWQQSMREILVDLDSDDDIDEVMRALWVCEAAARRWHMREAVESGRIKMPTIEDFDDASSDFFDE